MDREERDKQQLNDVLEGRLPASALQVPTTSSDIVQEEKREGEEASSITEPDWFAAYDEQKAEREALQRLKEEVEKKQRRKERLRRVREEYRANWQKVRRGACDLRIALILSCLGSGMHVPLPLTISGVRVVMWKMLI